MLSPCNSKYLCETFVIYLHIINTKQLFEKMNVNIAVYYFSANLAAQNYRDDNEEASARCIVNQCEYIRYIIF